MSAADINSIIDHLAAAIVGGYALIHLLRRFL